MLVDLNEENTTIVPISPPVSEDIFLLDVESFQQEFNQSQTESCISDETEENIMSSDEMLDEITQMYLEIIELSSEEESEVQEEIETASLKISSSNYLAPEDFTTIINLEISDDSKLDLALEMTNEKEIELKESVLNLGKINTGNCQTEKIVEWILQQQQMYKQKLNTKEEESWKETNHSQIITSELSVNDNLKHSSMEYQWKRRKKSNYKNAINADFTAPQKFKLLNF